MLVAQASKSLHDTDAITIKTLKRSLHEKDKELEMCRSRERVAQRLVERL